jgi:hypothetical protein
MKLPKRLLLSIAAPLLWGLWGALTEIPEKRLNPGLTRLSRRRLDMQSGR